MLYRFKSEAAADLILLDSAGQDVLRAIGKAPAPQGIIEHGHMPQAIAALQRAVATEEAEHGGGDQQGAGAAVKGVAELTEVSLRQRAVPFLDMLKRCHAAKADIVWGV